MSLISRLRSHTMRPRVYAGLYNVPTRSAFNFIKHFCTTNPTIVPFVESPTPVSETPKKPDKSLRTKLDWPRPRPLKAKKVEEKVAGKEKVPETLDEIICRMMANREWTTRLQNSIRRLVLVFDEKLVLNVIQNAKKPDHSLQFFRWVERSCLFKHTRDTHMRIIEVLGQAKMLNHARCILFDMPGKGLKWDEHMFIVMIYSYGKGGIVQEAVKFFDGMKDMCVERSIESYDALFKVILRRGRYMMAKRYYNKMLAEGIAPTRHTFNVLLWGFFLCKKEETAKRFYEDMKSRGIVPDVVTYNTLIYGFYRLSKAEEASALFEEMKSRNIAPTVVSYTTMIKGYVASGNIKDAFKMFEEMKRCGSTPPTDVTYTTLLPGLCDAMMLFEAQMVFEEMVKRLISPKDNSIFMKLLTCHCKTGDLNAAVGVVKAMLTLSVPTEAGHLGILIENCCKTKAYDRAVKILDILIKKELILKPRSTLDMEPSSYNAIIEYLCKNGKTEKAETLFRQLMKKGILDPIAFNNLIRGHAQEGNPEAAFDIQKIMIKRGVSSEADSYTLLIKSFLEKNEPADAKQVLDSMIENGLYPDSSLFRIVMEALFKDERVQTASRVMKIMVEKGVKDNMDLVGNILEALFMRGHVEEALGRIELLLQSGCNVDADHLLSFLSGKKKTIAAHKLLDFTLDRDFALEFSSYDKVVDCLLAAGKTHNAYALLCKISSKGGSTNEKSVESLIKTLNEEGNTKQADILGRMMKGGSKGKKQLKSEPVAS